MTNNPYCYFFDWVRMEESGAKWGIERFYRGLRNPLAPKPPIPKPSKPFYPAYGGCIIYQIQRFVKPFYPKYRPKNAQKMQENVGKTPEKIQKGLVIMVKVLNISGFKFPLRNV